MMKGSLPLSTPCHVIHLRGHWRYIGHSNGICWERMFGRPMRLDAQERVWLVASHLPPGAHVQVNEHDAGRADGDGDWAMDVTAWLQVRNRLRIILPKTTDTAVGEYGDESRPPRPGTSQESDVSRAAGFLVALYIYGAKPDSSSL